MADDVVVGNRKNALRDGKVAIEELGAIKMHAGIALKPLAVQGTSHHVKPAPQLFSGTVLWHNRVRSNSLQSRGR